MPVFACDEKSQLPPGIEISHPQKARVRNDKHQPRPIHTRVSAPRIFSNASVS